MTAADGTQLNLIKVRNPWGRKEFTKGQWADDGPGWNQHPDIKQKLNLVKADDGVFWVSMDEFEEYYNSVYLCACDMREFVSRSQGENAPVHVEKPSHVVATAEEYQPLEATGGAPIAAPVVPAAPPAAPVAAAQAPAEVPGSSPEPSRSG